MTASLSETTRKTFAAQPCSYIYPIYSVVKNHMSELIALLRLSHHALGRLEHSCSRFNHRARGNSTSSRHRLLKHNRTCQSGRNGGAERDRTVDPLLAKQVLSQLSYSPLIVSITNGRDKVVGLGRFELPTSPLSGVRSNQLSYRPETAASSC